MAFASGKKCISFEEILSKVTEAEILSFYLGITEIPCKINSPFRVDRNPSFRLYSKDGKKIKFIDFATKDRGDLIELLSRLWGKEPREVFEKIDNDIPEMTNKIKVRKSNSNSVSVNCINKNNVDIQCKIREWKDYDIEYWKSYGIDIKWLKYAEIYPISHKIVIKNGNRYVFAADKYAYVYVEHKDNKVTLKIYQPFNKEGFKWTSKHDSSVISLWTKVPSNGDRICICSSMKDALCLWANTGIPAIALQGEGYNMSNTAINELKGRFSNIYILLDNDSAGLVDGEKLAKQTGFINIVLPVEYGEKDISDLYKSINDREKFKEIILKLF